MYITTSHSHCVLMTRAPFYMSRRWRAHTPIPYLWTTYTTTLCSHCVVSGGHFRMHMTMSLTSHDIVPTVR